MSSLDTFKEALTDNGVKTDRLTCDCRNLTEREYWCGTEDCPRCEKPIGLNPQRTKLRGGDGIVFRWVDGERRIDDEATLARRRELCEDPELGSLSQTAILSVYRAYPDDFSEAEPREYLWGRGDRGRYYRRSEISANQLEER